MDLDLDLDLYPCKGHYPYKGHYPFKGPCQFKTTGSLLTYDFCVESYGAYRAYPYACHSDSDSDVFAP